MPNTPIFLFTTCVLAGVLYCFAIWMILTASENTHLKKQKELYYSCLQDNLTLKDCLVKENNENY
jgi:hypothetical protein